MKFGAFKENRKGVKNMKQEKITDLSSVMVSATVLGKMLGITERSVRRLAVEGVLVKTSSGRYQLVDSVYNYILNIKVSKTTKEQSRLEDDLDLEAEKAKHEQVKRQIAELKLSLMRGSCHKAEDVEAVMMDMLSNLRTRILGVPAKLTPLLLEKKEKGEINELLTKEMHELLLTLSDYRASDFYGKEFMETEGEGDEEEVDGYEA